MGSRQLGAILDDLEKTAKSGKPVSIGTLTEAMGSRTHAPFLIVPALLELTPIGAVPGMPTALGLLIIIFAAQIALGFEGVWLPKIVAKREISSAKVRKGVESLRPIAGRMDTWFHDRIEFLTTGIAIRIAAVACILIALMIPPLELVPFASSAPMLAIAVFGLALLFHDGAVMIAAMIIAALAVAAAFGFIVI